MRISVTLILVVIHVFALAQRPQKVTPFENYANCTVGFRIGRDTIWPAKFEMVQSLEGYPYDQEYWIVRDEGFDGLLSQRGTELIPCMYFSLKPTTKANLLLASKNGKWGMISVNGKVVIPLEYDKLEQFETPDGNSFFRTTIAGKTGIIDHEFRVVVPASYDKAELLYFGDKYIPFSSYAINPDTLHPYFFLTTNNRLSGVYNAQGKEIIKPSYHWIDLPERQHREVKVPVYFAISDTNSLTGVIDENGKIQMPFGDYHVNLYIDDRPGRSSSTVDYAIAEKVISEKKTRTGTETETAQIAFNLKTGKQSAEYPELFVYREWIVFHDKKGWGVLNDRFEVLYSGLIAEPSFVYAAGMQPIDFYDYQRDYDYDYYSYGVKIPRNNSPVIVSHITKKTNRRDSERNRVEEDFFGIVNFETKAATPVIYRKILEKRLDDKVYYWAFNFNDYAIESGSYVDVYDEKLQKKNTFRVSEFPSGVFSEWTLSGDYQKSLLLIADSAGNYGGVNPAGEIVIPFEYKTAPYDLSLNEGAYDMQRDAYLLGKHSKFGIFHADGKLAIPMIYDQIINYSSNGEEEQFLLAKKGNFSSLFDYSYRQIIDSCSEIYTENWLMYEFAPPGVHRRVVNSGLKIHAVRNSYLYVLLNKEFVPVDSSNQYFDSGNDYDDVGRHLVHKSGKVVPKNQEEQFRMTAKSEPAAAPVKKNRYNMPFVVDGKKDNSGRYWTTLTYRNWALFSKDSVQLSPISFDYPPCITSGYAPFRTNGQFGIIDSNMQIVIPATHKNILSRNEGYFVLGNDEWKVFAPGKPVHGKNFRRIGMNSYPNGYFVFKGDSVGIIGNNYRFLLPLTKINELPESIDLAKILGISPGKQQLPTMLYGVIFPLNNPEIYRKVNNKMLLETAQINTTENIKVEEPVFQANNYKEVPVWIVSSILSHPVNEAQRQKKLAIAPEYFTSSYYSVRYNEYHFTPDKPAYRPNFNEGNWQTFSAHHTFGYDGSAWQELKLSDLFRQDSGYVEFLDAKLTDAINKKQEFGVKCINIEEVIASYKSGFSLDAAGILFYQKGQPDFPVRITYKELKAYLLKPEAFGL